MRPVPILNAILVLVALYLLVFERDRLMGYLGDAATPAEQAQQVEETGTPAVPVQAMVSTAEPLDQGVLTRGQTEAARRVEVRAETTGKVISEPLGKGAQVEKGQLLCKLDPGTRPAALAEAQARLTEARLNATAAERLKEGGYRSETATASAQSALEAATAAVEAAQTELARLEITAPFAGLIEEDTAELGSLLSAGGLCATVIQLDPIKLVGYVPETEIDRVQSGAMVGARLATGREVMGKVTFVSQSADAATRTFRIEAEAPNGDQSIREGQTVEMIVAADGTKAHFLPASAMTLNDQGKLGVRLAVDGVARFAPVDFLRDTPEGVWLAGLPESATVIVVGQDYVTEGSPVAVTLVDHAPGDAAKDTPAPMTPAPQTDGGAADATDGAAQ
ncbi:efflux RND transporter periplasmic adaptor subunit [Thioclava sp. IC9]|uniref:efflux RND transporter periplasmic adaptor subunit n=1 Tax=Thioclava sp. IC9 TaxID=1973007 RepID=UPI000B54099A|nr:efflux RND transporter periplasmic adaptor subunit [Thioclava sp. IC9]OWY04116.1 efflux transporter periplasmic adaptor subunit [Thioclava sp. IC9]